MGIITLHTLIKWIYCLILTTCFLSQPLIAQFQGPVDEILSGYGSRGIYSVAHLDIPNDHWAAKDISIFYPAEISEPMPTIFYSHGYTSTDTNFHIETLHHLATRGYAVVFVPYRSLGASNAERYLTLYDGFVKAARETTGIVDTTRIGFYGHSFGGGATPRIAYQIFTENNWGSFGRFMYCSAPWYSFELESSVLPNFPVDCNMLMVLYDDDKINDHRMGMDIFNNIAIPDINKDCLIVYSDTVSGYHYMADHLLPVQYAGNGEYDALDQYVSFRLMDALADYSFTGNFVAKEIALGNGSSSQIEMGGQLYRLYSTDEPFPVYPESRYLFPCTANANERTAFCQELVSVINLQPKSIELFPNYTKRFMTISGSYSYYDIQILDMNGVIHQEYGNTQSPILIDLDTLPAGLHFLHIENQNHASICLRKILKTN